MVVILVGFVQLIYLFMGLVGGKLILFLEGGYNFCVLVEGVSVLFYIFLGDFCFMLELFGVFCWSVQVLVFCVLEVFEFFWEVFVRLIEIVERDNMEEDNVEESEEEGFWEFFVFLILIWLVLQFCIGLVYD